MKQTLRVLFGLLLITTILGCEEDQIYISCPFDKTITAVCDEGDGGAELTCVIEAHPQCPEDICLSWKGAASTCTRRCDPNGSDCPADSTCSTYGEAENKYFCVQNVVLSPPATE